MEFLRRIIEKINTQLSDLSASQRLAIGLCIVVIVGSFLWLVRWSVELEYVRLLEEPMTPDQLAAAREALLPGEVRIVGEYVYVPAAVRREMYWKLQSANALPPDTSITFAKLIENDSPFRPESENNFRRRVALQNELANVIASSTLIRRAEIFITDTNNRRIGGPPTTPTASIKLTLVSGQAVDAGMVKACAAIVAGAVPGLLPHKVSVIDGTTLREHKVPDPQDAFAQGLLQEQKKKEEHFRAKILGQLSYIPGVRVAVSVELDSAATNTRSYQYAKPQVLEEQRSSTDSRMGRGSGEPGVGPNVGQSIDVAGSAETLIKEDETTKFQEQRLARETTVQKIPFGLMRATASVQIPRSFIDSVLRRMSGTDATPTPEEIDAKYAEEEQRVRAVVKNILMTRNDDDVEVLPFYDMGTQFTIMPDGSMAVATSVAGGSEITAALRNYGPQVGLGFLAFMGLFMMSRLGRRSAGKAREHHGASLGRAKETEHSEDEPLSVAARPVGMAAPTEGASLVGKEIDDDALRGDEMTQQVSRLVEENPNAVARLIRRWADADG